MIGDPILLGVLFNLNQIMSFHAEPDSTTFVFPAF